MELPDTGHWRTTLSAALPAWNFSPQMQTEAEAPGDFSE
jgi:hypothetical protein